MNSFSYYVFVVGVFVIDSLWAIGKVLSIKLVVHGKYT